MQEGVKKEIAKLLDAEIIYLISYSDWISPLQVAPKKGGMVVVKNEWDEVISITMVTGGCMCVDYIKLNDATRKDYFPFPFIDQISKQLA